MNVLESNNKKEGGGEAETLKIKPLLNKNVVFWNETLISKL